MKREVAFFKAGHWPTLVSAFLYFDVSFMIWVLLGALGNFVSADFGLTPVQKGFMTALPLLAGSILRLMFGLLADTIGGKKAGCLGLLVTLAPLLAGWVWADSLARVYVLGLLLGVAGASFAVALPMASRWYPANYQGLAMGIAGAGNSGTLLATLFAPRLAEAHGWHTVFGLAIIPLAAVALVFFVFAKDAPQQGKRSESEFLSLLTERDTYLFSVFYGVTFGGFVGLASFLSIFLHDQYGVSRIQAGDLTSVCVLGGSFLRPVGGFLADKFGGIRILVFLYGSIVVLVMSVAQLPALGLAVPLLFLIMACLGLGNGSVFQLVPQRFGERVGLATGILGASGGLGGFFLPTILGWFKESSGSYGFGLAALAGLSGLALALLLLAQSDWIGVWMSEGGRVNSASIVLPPEEVEPV